jgi:hypothetical protein
MSKAIFKAHISPEPNFTDMLRPLTKQEDFRKYLFANIDHELTFTIEQSVDKNDKLAMYAYFNGVIVPAYVSCMYEIGELTNKADATMELKVLFLKDIFIDSKGIEHYYVPSQSDLTKVELLQFIQKVLIHLEIEFGMIPPDSTRFKEASLSKNLKRIMWKV